MDLDKLLQSEVRVINIGLKEFARDLESRKTPVVHVDWSPPAATNAKIALLLAKMGG
jgi:FdrA protein